MGRREQPLDSRQGPLAQFACELRELRRQAGSPPYRRLAADANYSASTLAAAAAGHRLPRPEVLAAFVRACGGDPAEWEQRRLQAHRLSTTPPAPPAPPAAPAPVEGPPSAATAESGRAAARPRSAPSWGPALRRAVGLVAVLVACLAFGASAPGGSTGSVAVVAGRVRLQDTGRWLRDGADIPPGYRALIVRAGTMCAEPEITPALVAAMLKAESGFDPALSDPARDEYGIARWTPRVLRYYLPPDRQGTVPVPPFGAEDSILAVGRMLCAIAPELQGVPGDPALNLAAAYRTATWIVQRQDPARLAGVRPYLDQVRDNLRRYRAPAGPP
ncbi:hypothetical protein GCM10009760_59440 [Kitasatospora kazusensis]|uniref:HTH cro/C1-type domain-containing protein n=1 Tax=Kitasatospora kazusensis TaxID=407974 RepID=A0ABP5M0M9_9ACTN